MGNKSQQLLDAGVARWVEWVSRAPTAVLALFAMLAGVSLYYTSATLSIDTDRAEMLSPELPFRQDYETYKRAFPQYVDTFLLVIEAATPELARRGAARLSRRLEQDDALFKTVWRPGSGVFFDRHGLLYLDTQDLQALADDLARVQPFLGTLTQDQSLRGLFDMTSAALEASRRGEALELAPLLAAIDKAVNATVESRFYQLSWQDLMLGEESSLEAKRQLILVQPRLDFSKLLPAQPAIAGLRRLASQLRLDHPGRANLRITGDAAMEYEEMQSVARGAGLGALTSFALVTLVLVFGLRSARLAAASMFTLLVSLIITTGFATLAVGRLNLISIAFAILNIGLGADYAIHLCLRYRELKQSGVGSMDALRGGVGHVGASLVLAAATTAVGFYAFVPTDYLGVSELGLIAGTGLFISLFVSLTLLPALLALWPVPVRGPAPERPSASLTSALAQFPLRHARVIRAGALMLAVASALTIPFAGFDYNPLNLRDPDSESVATFKALVRTSDTPPWSITVLAPDLRAAQRLATRLSKLEGVDKTVTLKDFVPSHQATKLAVIGEMQLILALDLMGSYQQPPPGYAQQIAALKGFERELTKHLAADKATRWRAVVLELRDNLRRVLAMLGPQPTRKAESRINRLQRSLLATLPATLSLLKQSLTASTVRLSDLPPELAAHWRTAGGDYRVEVFPRADLSDSDALRAFVHSVRGVAPRATGLPVISLEAGEAVVDAFQQAFLTSLVVIAALLLALMRGAKDAALVLVPLLLGGLITGAAVVASGGAFNFANIIALPLLLGIGLDNGIHMMHRLRSQSGAYTELLRTSTARAVFYSALTTIVSFGNLAFSTHPGTASLGSLLTVGVLLTLATALIVLPALLELSERPA